MRSVRRRMKIGLQRKPRRNFEPSIGVMGGMRPACCGFVAVLCSLAGAAPAVAADQDVLKWAPMAAYTLARTVRCRRAAMPRRPARERARSTPTTAAKRRRTVIGELKRLQSAAEIAPEEYALRRADYEDAARRARKLRGTRATK